MNEFIGFIMKYIGYVVSFLTGAGGVGALFLWGLKNLDKLETLRAWFYRTFSWAYRKWEYGNVAANIQATVNTVGEFFNRDAGNVLPHAMKIEWAKTAQDAEAFLRNGEIIVTMDYSPNRDRNLVVSTFAYLGKGLLPRARPYIDRTLMRATDFTVAKSIFMSAKPSSAMSFFFENYLEPEIEEDPRLRDDCTLLDKLQEAGFFSRIFLRQLHHTGEKVFPVTPDDATRRESRDFAEFLERIAIKEKGKDVPGGLTFPGSRIRVSVMLVARPETRFWGIWRYARRVEIDLDRGVEHMYICARGADNISLAEEVASEQEKGGKLTVLARHRFSQTIEGEEYNAVCIVCAMNLLVRPKAAEPSSVLYRLLEEHIDELRDGRIEVVALARQQGVKSKIAVRSLASGVDALRCCTEQARLTAIKSALRGEQLEFIRWRNDPASLIVAALTPLNPNRVQEVITDLETRRAIVRVDWWEEKRKALGRGNQNMRCAMELTGWQIEVEDVSGEKRGPDRDREGPRNPSAKST